MEAFEAPETQEIIYFLVVWIIGSLAALARSGFERDSSSLKHFFSLGLVGGFLAFIGAGSWISWSGFGGYHWLAGLVIGTSVGLGGRESVTLLHTARVYILAKYKIEEPEDEK